MAEYLSTTQTDDLNARLRSATEAAERATGLAELYANAIIEISTALSKHASGGGVMRARTIIASLAPESPDWPGLHKDVAR